MCKIECRIFKKKVYVKVLCNKSFGLQCIRKNVNCCSLFRFTQWRIELHTRDSEQRRGRSHQWEILIMSIGIKHRKLVDFGNRNTNLIMGWFTLFGKDGLQTLGKRFHKMLNIFQKFSWLILAYPQHAQRFFNPMSLESQPTQ